MPGERVKGKPSEANQYDVKRLRESFEKGAQWTKATAHVAFGWNDRHFRSVVSQLREMGYPVISTSEQGSTYRRAKDHAELIEFVERELVSRTRDIENQIRALREGADRHFGSDQLRLAV